MTKFYLSLIPLLVVWLPILTAQKAKNAFVADFNGRPTIYINETPVSPQIYALTHAYGARWSWEERPSRNLANFCEAGIRLFQVDIFLEDIWYKNAPALDIAKAQRQIQGVLDACPEASVVVRFHVNSPFWWNEQHPEECTAYLDGPIDQRQYGPPFNMEDGDIDRPLRASLASVLWRQEAGEKLALFCKQLAKTKQGKSVVGLHISGGIYGEWHYWGFMKHEPDGGPAMTAYFRQWLKKKYQTTENLQQAWHSPRFTLDNATVPDTTERNFTGDGVFRNPETEQRVVDYFKAQQEVVVEDIEFFCRLAKQHWPRRLIVGVFYGYFHSIFSRQAAGGHLFIERILDCPYIDYVAAPQSYWESTRKLGGSGISRGIVESARLHGKLWLDEMDNGYLQQNRIRDFVRSEALQDTNYLQVLRRSTYLPMLRGIGFWFYDFGPLRSSGWWDSPLYLSAIKKDIAFWNSQLKYAYQSVADVLYVYDQAHFYYAQNKKTPISTAIPDKGVEEAMRCGITGDHVYLFDLPKVNIDQYKAVVFVNCFSIDTAIQSFIVEKVAQNERTLVWNYLPAYIGTNSNSLQHVVQLTGFNLAHIASPDKPTITSLEGNYTLEGPLQPLAAIIDTVHVKSIALLSNGNQEVVIGHARFAQHQAVMATAPIQGSDLFRAILKQAGCHVYNESNDFTFAHGKYILLHTATGGVRHINLRNGKTVELQLERATTLLLDGETGEVVLR